MPNTLALSPGYLADVPGSGAEVYGLTSGQSVYIARRGTLIGYLDAGEVALSTDGETRAISAGVAFVAPAEDLAAIVPAGSIVRGFALFLPDVRTVPAVIGPVEESPAMLYAPRDDAPTIEVVTLAKGATVALDAGLAIILYGSARFAGRTVPLGDAVLAGREATAPSIEAPFGPVTAVVLGVGSY